MFEIIENKTYKVSINLIIVYKYIFWFFFYITFVHIQYAVVEYSKTVFGYFSYTEYYYFSIKRRKKSYLMRCFVSNLSMEWTKDGNLTFPSCSSENVFDGCFRLSSNLILEISDE